MDTPLKGTSPNMVAVGTSQGPGATTQNVMAQFFGSGYAIPVWKMRDGRNKTFALWDDYRLLQCDTLTTNPRPNLTLDRGVFI